MTNSKPLNVALAGLGTVGGGLVSLLQENAELVRRHTGREIVLKRVLERDTSKYAMLPAGCTPTTDIADVTDDPEIDVLVELIGGTGVASTLIDRALDHGKHIVTANKALLAEKGVPLFAKAAANKCILRHEASVAGAIPIVEAFRESLVGNRTLSLMGILNGTSNYILSAMSSDQLDFAVALKQAQELGYAEADPTLDIDGNDAAHKLVLLIRLAYGVHYDYERLLIQGVRNMSPQDIGFARDFGYSIKLIAQVRDIATGGTPMLEAGVFPALVPQASLLGSVNGVFNAVLVDGNAAGGLFFHGRGAGSLPTAGAVLADIMAVARGGQPNNTGFACDDLPKADIVPPEDWHSSYYVRLMVEDTPGVLRDISGCMAAVGISVARMIQHEGKVGESVPLVFMTHETTARAMQKAVTSAADAGLLREPAVFYKVLG